MKFKYEEQYRERKPQEFNKDEIFVEKAGKKINMYEYIQNAAVDCDVYEVLEKYGCIEKMGIDPVATYQDFTNIQNIRSPYDATLKATALWNGLPLEIRAKFDHDANKFMKEGEKWLKDEITKLETTQKTEMSEPDTTTTKGANNE